MFEKKIKVDMTPLPQQAAIPKVIYKKSSKESSAKGSFPEALWGLWLEGLEAADSWGKEDRKRKRKKISEWQNMKAENVMKEEVIFCFVIFNKYKQGSLSF